MTLWVLIAFMLWISMIGVGAWILTRMNTQVRRMAESPTPRQAFDVLKDMQEAHDLKLFAVERKAENNSLAIEDLALRHRGLQNRMNVEERKNDKLDTVAMADYIQSQQLNEQPSSQVAPSSVDKATGEEIDYR